MSLLQISAFHSRSQLYVHIQRIFQIGAAVYEKIPTQSVKHIFQGRYQVGIPGKPGNGKMKGQIQLMVLIIEIRILRIKGSIG